MRGGEAHFRCCMYVFTCMKKIFFLLVGLTVTSLLWGQQKANFKLADRFTNSNFRFADGNSMSIYPMYTGIVFGIRSRQRRGNAIIM